MLEPLSVLKAIEATTYLIWGAVGFFFLLRYFQRRVLVSLAISVMSFGWPLTVLISLSLWPKCFALTAGGFVVWAIVTTEAPRPAKK